eukprot:scpid25312/ scgid15851/ MMS19 nucleotide excision repair protein homolog; MET18 homolog; MMS19-like protein
MAERLQIDNYLQGDNSTNAITSLSKCLVDKSMTFQGVITALAPELIHTDAEMRARGTRLIADLIRALPGTYLNEAELNHVCTFFCDRLKDQHVVVPHVIFGLLSLVRIHLLKDAHAVQIVEAIGKEVHVQALIRVDRSAVYNIIHGLLSNHIQGLQTMGPDFVFSFIQMMDGEQDPRNLLLAFNLVPTIAQSFPIDRFIEDLFDVTSCYFPISFTPQPDDPSAITQEQLCDALRKCLCATPAFASLTVPLILEKLTANVASAKLDSVLTLSEAAPVFGAKELAQYIEGIWLGLKTEIFRASSENLVNACLKCIPVLLGVFSEDSSDEHLKDMTDRIIKECCHHYKQPQLGLSSISTQILSAACSGSAAACSIVLDASVPVITAQYAEHTTSSLQCSLLDSLKSLVQVAVPYHSKSPAELPLATHIDSILSIIFTSINDGDAALRVFGCKCMQPFMSSATVLSAGQVSLCVEHIMRTLQNDEAAEVRTQARQLVTGACTHFPDTALQCIVPSVSEWLQLRRTSCDAGLKAHITEDYVLDLTGHLACSASLLPVLVELWIGHLEHLLREQWSEVLVDRCHTLLATLQTGLSGFSGETSAMLEIVWQPIVLHLIECITTAAKFTEGDDLPVQVLLFTNLAVLQSASKLVATLIRSAESRVQTDVITRLVATATESTSSGFAPFEASASPRQSQYVVLLAAVVPGIPGSALPDGVHTLLVPSLNMAVSSLHDESATSACLLSAALLNKLTDESALSTALHNASTVISNALEHGNVNAAVSLLAWVTRAMVLRSHSSSMELSAKLISLFTRNGPEASAAAAAFSLLLNDDASRNLTQAGGAMVMFLHKQKFFIQVRPQLVEGFKEAGDGSVKDHFLTALSHLLFCVPEQVLLSEIPPLLPLVIQCLSSSSAQLLTSSLNAIMALMNGAPDVMGQYVSDIIPLLLKLSRFQGNMKVRQSSLRCLGSLTALPHHLLYPHKNRLTQDLVASLDDHKRLVRRDAVECRNRWIMLGSAPP